MNTATPLPPTNNTTPMNVYQKMSFVFGVGALEKVAHYAKRFGKRVLIITGWNQVSCNKA